MSVRKLVISRKQLLQCLETTGVMQQAKRFAHMPRKVPVKKKPNRLIDVLLLVVPCTTFGLGCWQIKRKELKEALLKRVDEARKLPTEPLPEDLSDIQNLEYRSVRVRGKFIHSKEIILAPRKKEVPEEERWVMGEDGVNVITPLRRSDTGETVLINRGWVDKMHRTPETRLEGQITDDVEVTGMLRLPTKRLYNLSDSTIRDVRGTFLLKDVPLMSKVAGTAPVLIDADPDSTVKGGPIGGQYRLHIRNDHLQYIITWFAICGISSYMWLRHFRR